MADQTSHHPSSLPTLQERHGPSSSATTNNAVSELIAIVDSAAWHVIMLPSSAARPKWYTDHQLSRPVTRFELPTASRKLYAQIRTYSPRYCLYKPPKHGRACLGVLKREEKRQEPTQYPKLLSANDCANTTPAMLIPSLGLDSHEGVC